MYAAPRRVRGGLTDGVPGLRAALRIWVALVLAFPFVPIVLIVLYAFNSSNIEKWPIAGLSVHWFSVAWHDSQVRGAFLLSLRVGLIATALAVLLGSATAYALHKFAFFGRGGHLVPCWCCRSRCPASSPGSR